MRYVVTHHEPTAVVDSARGQFTALGVYTLAVAKVNKIELYELADDGLQHLCELEIWGQVSNIQEVTREDRPSALLVTTDHPTPMLLLLEYASKPSPSLLVKKHSDLKGRSSRSGRISEYCQCSVVHAPSELVATSAYAGSLDLSTTSGADENMKTYNLRMEEQTLVAFAFLPLSAGDSAPTLALLYVDVDGERKLATRSLLNVPTPGSNKSLVEIEVSPPTGHITKRALTKDWDAEMIVSIPAYEPGIKPGILVLGEGQAVWFAVQEDVSTPGSQRRRSSSATSPDNRRDKGKGRASIDKGKAPAGRLDYCTAKLRFGKIVSATYVGHDKVIYGDELGALFLLLLDRRPSDGYVLSMQRFDLGEVSSPSSITPLSGPYFYVGSKCGDSQLIRLVSCSSSDQSAVEVLRTQDNLAPILDFSVTDPEKIVQKQIVTCSGRQNCGSLRVIRSGVAFDELAVVDDVSHVKSMFRIRSSFDAENDTYLVVTRISRTLLYAFDGSGTSVVLSEIDPQEASGLIRSLPTLACSNMRVGDLDLVVQVTPRSMVALDAMHWTVQYRMDFEGEIVAAALNQEFGVVALKGGRVQQIKPQADRFHVSRERSASNGDSLEEVSCIGLPDIARDPQLGIYAVVGFWGSNTIQIFDLESGFIPMNMASPLPAQSHIPVSVLLTTFGKTEGDAKPYLLVGLGNGTVSSYTLKAVEAEDQTTTVAVDESRSFSWGTLPVTLSLCKDRNSGLSVFACGDRPALLFLKNDRLTASPIKLRNIQSGSIFNCHQFPDSYIFATRTNLIIGQINELQKLDVRTIPLGLDSPIRIAYHSSLRAYGVVCHRNELNRDTGKLTESSSFKLFDDLTFEHINNFTARPEEMILCVNTLTDVSKTYETDYFVLGTYEISDKETDPGRGRILLFEEDANRKIRLATTTDVEGAVYAIAPVGNALAAAVNGTVRMYFLATKSGNVTLQHAFTWTSAYMATTLEAHGDTLLVGDGMRSVCLLRWTGSRLETIHHDYSSLWIQTAESMEDGSVIASEINNNIVSWRRNARLEQDGSWYLGEGINRYRIASLMSSTSDEPKTQLVFATNAGRIGVILPLEEQRSMDLTALERNMGFFIKGPGAIEHEKRRKPQATPGLPLILTTKDATGFIDGDFVERLLDFERGSQDVAHIIRGKTQHHRLEKSYSEYVGILEELQRLH